MQWRVGAVLEAAGTRDPSAQWMLNVDGTNLPVRLMSIDGAIPSEGEQLQLRVLRNSPTLALETVQAAPAAEPTLGDAVRRYLPRQIPPSLLMANLNWLTRDPRRTAPLEGQIAAAVHSLWQALPQTDDLTDAGKLAATVLRSGMQFEAQLAAATPQSAAVTTQRDLKALLLGLKQALSESARAPMGVETVNTGSPPMSGDTLRPLPVMPATLSIIDAPDRQLAELARQTDGAVARLTALQAAGAAGAAWILEIPVRNENRAEFVRMKFERNSGGAPDEEAPWSVEVALDLGMAGEMFARVTWAQRQISVQLRAASPEIVKTLQQYAPELTDDLRKAGLNVQQVICLHGMPAEQSERRAAALLDVRA
jgi:hypothetical protein